MEYILQKIIEKLQIDSVVGDRSISINSVISLNIENNNPNALMWVSSKNIHLINKICFGIIICENNGSIHFNENCTYVLVDKPRSVFIDFINEIFKEKNDYKISNNASIHSEALIGKNVSIGDFVVIERDVTIKDNVIIGHNNVIHSNTIIHNNVKIGSNNTIGANGFGYEKNQNGDYVSFPHIGGVIIFEGVEIGNNNCIDRGTIDNTLIHRNCKIDNLVHISHNVVIGENSLIIANSMIGGSASIGDNCWVSPSSSVLNKINIGNNCIIGMGAVVLKNVDEFDIIVGNPGKIIKKT